jgi:hypothetical protein
MCVHLLKFELNKKRRKVGTFTKQEKNTKMWHITITKGTNKGKLKEKRKREKVKRLYKHLLFFGDFLEVRENNIK